MNNKDDIVERLNALMQERGLSLRGVEKLTNVPFSTVGRLKRGENVSDEARERVRCFLDGEPYSAPHKELSEHMADISALFAAKAARIAELEAEVKRLRPLVINQLEGEYLEQRQSEGFWRSCTGCHETNEGQETGYYPYHQFFGCYLGSGCHECGYLGAIWDDTDYEHMAKFMREYQEEPTP